MRTLKVGLYKGCDSISTVVVSIFLVLEEQSMGLCLIQFEKHPGEAENGEF